MNSARDLKIEGIACAESERKKGRMPTRNIKEEVRMRERGGAKKKPGKGEEGGGPKLMKEDMRATGLLGLPVEEDHLS